MDVTTIETLFGKFEIIWGRRWEVIEEKHPELIADEWREALAGLSRQAIQQGLSKTRQSLTWPPSIAEFLQACQGVEVARAPNHGCSVPGCPDVGSMCTSPWGSDWICNRHYHDRKG